MLILISGIGYGYQPDLKEALLRVLHGEEFPLRGEIHHLMSGRRFTNEEGNPTSNFSDIWVEFVRSGFVTGIGKNGNYTVNYSLMQKAEELKYLKGLSEGEKAYLGSLRRAFIEDVYSP